MTIHQTRRRAQLAEIARSTASLPMCGICCGKFGPHGAGHLEQRVTLRDVAKFERAQRIGGEAGYALFLTSDRRVTVYCPRSCYASEYAAKPLDYIAFGQIPTGHVIVKEGK